MGSHWPGPPLLNVLFSYRPTERAGLTTRHLTGTADPSQEYILRDLSSSKDERIRQTLNLIERMPAALTSTAFDIYASLVLTLSSKSSSSCLFLNGVTSGGCHFSLGLSLILKEVAGESGWLRPLLALRPAFGAEHLTLVFFFFFPHVQIMHTVVQDQSTFGKGLHVHPSVSMTLHSRGLFTWQQHQFPVASP